MVTIIDPHIKKDENYHVYKEAKELGFFVKVSHKVFSVIFEIIEDITLSYASLFSFLSMYLAEYHQHQHKLYYYHNL